MRSFRRTTLVAGFVALTCAVAPGAAAATSPTLHVKPSTQLSDGQVVIATVTGFPANANVLLVECEKKSGYVCDTYTGQIFFADSSGNVTARYIVTRMVTFDNKQVDCAHTNKCMLVADDFPNTDVVVPTAITFDPKTSIRPPLKLTVSVARTDPVDAAGVVTLHGTITCNRPAALNIVASVAQPTDGTRRFGTSKQFCAKAETVTWQLSVKSGTPKFVPGPAQVEVGVPGQAGASRAHASAKRSVTLARN